METVCASAITALFEQYGFIHPGGAVYDDLRDRARAVGDGGGEAQWCLPDTAAFVFMAALPYPLVTSCIAAPSDKSDRGAIAPFAQANYYREAVSKLKKISLAVREKTGIRKRDIRIFCNSPLPEKLFASLLGVGFYGKNNLIITEKAGTACVLAGLILYAGGNIVFDIPRLLLPVEYGKRCGSCTACIENCPTGALTSAPGAGTPSAERSVERAAPASRFEREKCLQNHAAACAMLEESVMEAWGNRVYGCVSCQEICPFNRGPFNRGAGAYNQGLEDRDPLHGRGEADTPVTEKGVLGPCVSLEQFLALTSAELSKKLKNTALDMNWIDVDAIKRNCLIAAAHRKAVRLVPLIREYTEHTSPVLRETARWTLRKLGPD